MLARREQADKECEVLETVRFRAGDTIFSQNEWGNAAYLVNCGQVEVTTAQGSVCRTVRTAGPGEVFGDACLMEPGLRRITATQSRIRNAGSPFMRPS